MLYDGGALCKNGKRDVSKIFRFLSNNPPRVDSWPKHYVKDIGVFLMTPGVSWRWVKRNFNLDDQRLVTIRKYAKRWEHLGMKNMISATAEDAYWYCQYGYPRMSIPQWVMPFIIDDIKSGMKNHELCKKWKIGSAVPYRMKKGVFGSVFHSGNVHGRGKNLDRSA